MAMNHRLLRPLAKVIAAVSSFLVVTIAGDQLITQGGDKMRTIQGG